MAAWAAERHRGAQLTPDLLVVSIVGDTAKWRGVPMAGPTLRLIEQAATELPKSCWAINAMEEERRAA